MLPSVEFRQSTKKKWIWKKIQNIQTKDFFGWSISKAFPYQHCLAYHISVRKTALRWWWRLGRLLRRRRERHLCPQCGIISGEETVDETPDGRYCQQHHYFKFVHRVAVTTETCLWLLQCKTFIRKESTCKCMSVATLLIWQSSTLQSDSLKLKQRLSPVQFGVERHINRFR